MVKSMTKSTIDNISNRAKWLNTIIAGSLNNTEVKEHLTNMRRFCKHSVTGKFRAISLNTLKTNCIQADIKYKDLEAWEAFRLLLEDARDSVDRLAAEAEPSKENSAQRTQKLATYQMHAQVCYLAFVDLLKDINQFKNNSAPMNPKDEILLDRIIAKSHSQLAEIRSPDPHIKPMLNLVR